MFRDLALQFVKQTKAMSLSSTALLLNKIIFYFLHDVQKATDAFISVLHDFGFSQKLELYDPKKHHTQPTTSHHSNNYQPGFP